MPGYKVTIDGSKFPPVLKMEVEGMKGVGCTSFADELNKVLKLSTKNQTLKADYKEVKQRLPARR